MKTSEEPIKTINSILTAGTRLSVHPSACLLNFISLFNEVHWSSFAAVIRIQLINYACSQQVEILLLNSSDGQKPLSLSPFLLPPVCASVHVFLYVLPIENQNVHFTLKGGHFWRWGHVWAQTVRFILCFWVKSGTGFGIYWNIRDWGCNLSLNVLQR